MAYDIDLLRVISNKDAYDRFLPHIKKHNVSSITNDIVQAMGEYWPNYPGRTEVIWDELRTFFFIVKGKKLKDPATYEAVFDKLSVPTASPVADQVLKKLVELDYASQVHDTALSIVNGKATVEDVQPIIDAYKKEIGSSVDVSSVFVDCSLAYIKDVVAAEGLSWRLQEFNVSLGPLRKGDFIIIGARPETGKTTVVASEATHMLKQLPEDKCVVWINNEESSKKVMMRVIQSFHGVTTRALLDDVDRYEEEFKAAGGDRFLILDDDSPYKDVTKLTRLLKELNPGLIIFDQLDKVGGFYNEREDLRIGKLYEWARDLAKTYCPVISISQISEAGEGVKWLNNSMLRGSKTDKAGEADAIILIGKDNEPGKDLDRFITIGKNKLFGGPETLEAHRHGNFEVQIDPAHARYLSRWKTK
jgi:replicative DNA helicase